MSSQREKMLSVWDGPSVRETLSAPPKDLGKELEKQKHRVIKRATFLLNPTKDNPRFYTLYVDRVSDILGRVEQLAESSVKGSLSVIEQGVVDSWLTEQEEKKQPGRAERKARRQAQHGYGLLKELLSDLEKNKSPLFGDLLEGIQHATSLRNNVHNPTIKEALRMVKLVAQEVQDPKVPLGKKKTPRKKYSEKAVRYLFAAVVGLTQTVVVDELSLAGKSIEKYLKRDDILLFCMNQFALCGQGDPVEYFIAQKAIQPPQKRSKNETSHPAIITDSE